MNELSEWYDDHDTRADVPSCVKCSLETPHVKCGFYKNFVQSYVGICESVNNNNRHHNHAVSSIIPVYLSV